MKVTQIISDTNIGGGGRSLLNYLAHCNRAEFSPSVILPKGSALTERIQALDVPLIEIDAMADKSYDSKAKTPLAKALKEFSPDLVHTHGSFVGRIVASKQKRPVLYTKHCAFPPSGLKATSFGKTLIRLVDKKYAQGVVAVGHSTRDMLVESGIPAHRVHVMYNGVTPLETSPQYQEECRRHYGFLPEDYVVGILARVETYKGHDTLFQAFALLLEENLPVKLLIAGEGSYLEKLKADSQKFPKDSVCFAGFVQNVTEALSAMNLQVNASYESETSCLSLLEGMSMGLPAVASDIGGNPFLIRHEENGLIFPKQDPKALAEGIKRLYQDEKLYQDLSQGSEKLFQEQFTGEIFAKNTEEVYQKIYSDYANK